VALVVVTLLSAMDATIVATALPSIVADLGGERLIGWVFAAYTLAMTVSMPVFGRLGDLRGRRTLYLGSIAAFVLASVLCGFASDLAQLIGLRFVQGIAGGGLLVLGQAVVADAVPARERPRFLAPIASVFAVASVVSPLLGGGLTDTVGWRWIFWVNAPLGGLALVLAVVSVPRRTPERTGERLDVPGAALLAAWVTATVLVGAWGGTTFPWTSPSRSSASVCSCGAAVGTRTRSSRRPCSAAGPWSSAARWGSSSASPSSAWWATCPGSCSRPTVCRPRSPGR
jgi:MFS family permease